VYAFGVIARIDYQSVARFRIADNMAIALQHPDGEDFMNEFGGFRHGPNIAKRVSRNRRFHCRTPRKTAFC
jgi:hypothetical protein